MILRNALLLCLSMLVIAGCQTHKASFVDADASPTESALTAAFAPPVSTSEAREAVLQSLRNRGWTVTSSSSDTVEATLVHRRYDSSIRIELNPGEMVIFSDSWRLDRHGERTVREHPDGWLRNIEHDVRRTLEREI